jgi:hypothetical protein
LLETIDHDGYSFFLVRDRWTRASKLPAIEILHGAATLLGLACLPRRIDWTNVMAEDDHACPSCGGQYRIPSAFEQLCLAERSLLSFPGEQ